MNPKLLEILKKAKSVDERAKKYDSMDKSTLQANVESRPSTPINEVNYSQQTVKKQKIEVGSDVYKQRVKESKLPPEIQKAMLDNPIPQPDMPGTFSLDEDLIKEINPNYGSSSYSEDDEFDFLTEKRHIVKESVTPTQKGFDEGSVRKMIAEEIAKALPSIVEKYFDKKMIQENVKLLKSIVTKKRT